MHELSICMSLMEQLESIARERGADSIVRVELEVGVLSGVEPELLRNAWPIASAGTVAEQAELSIQVRDVVVECTNCGAQTAARPNRLVCGECSAAATRVVAGEEMTLMRVELQASGDAAAAP